MVLTYQSQAEAEQACLLLPIKKVVCSCIKSLMDAYGEDYDPR